METFLPLLGFVVASTVTPGPNNLMVLTSGANYGLRRTLPHIAGIALGFPVMIVAIGLGIGVVFKAAPWLEIGLKYAAFVYLLWLAWKVAQAGRPEAKGGDSKPLSLLQAAAFQWVNPKAWAIIIGAVALYTSPDGNHLVQVGLIALLFGLVCIPNGIVWALFGTAIARFLDNDRHRRIFNIVMAVLLVASVVPTLFE
jgi:threonine/homoserine/homoserine lactone efflux protein